MNFKKIIPILDWLPRYNSTNLKGDISAGLTVGVVLIPQSMAYAMLAGLPPVYGLYASTLPVIVYAILGTSPHLSIGPVALDSILIASGIGILASSGTEEYIRLAIILTLMVGVLQFLFGVLKLGFLTNFLSRPVISGFTSAAAIIISISQLKHLTRLNLPQDSHIEKTLVAIFSNIHDTHLPTLLLGLGGIAIIFIIKKVNKSIPGAIITVIAGIGAVYLFGLDNQGVKIIEDIPSTLPSFKAYNFNISDVQSLYPMAFTLALIGFLEATAIGKTIQAKHKYYKIDANQQLVALGLSNIIGSFFKSFAVTSSFSRSAINEQSGAKTGIAIIISAISIILSILFFTPVFYYLPNAILAAIIIASVFNLIKLSEAKRLWKTDRKDFYMLLATFLATLLFGIQQGIGTGVILSLAMVIYNSTYPHIAILGKIPGTNQYRNILRFPNTEQLDDVLIIRLDAQLFFANVSYFEEHLDKVTQRKGNALKLIILNAEAINRLDSSGANMLGELVEEYQNRQISFFIADVKGPVRDTLFRAGLVDKIGKSNFFMDTDEAVSYYLKLKNEEDPQLSKHALQTNLGHKKS